MVRMGTELVIAGGTVREGGKVERRREVEINRYENLRCEEENVEEEMHAVLPRCPTFFKTWNDYESAAILSWRGATQAHHNPLSPPPPFPLNHP